MAISGIHTHSGPAGYLQYLLYDITSMGFVRETFDVLVNGIVAVSRALSPCSLTSIGLDSIGLSIALNHSGLVRGWRQGAASRRAKKFK